MKGIRESKTEGEAVVYICRGLAGLLVYPTGLSPEVARFFSFLLAGNEIILQVYVSE